jgi:hypothetical protein
MKPEAAMKSCSPLNVRVNPPPLTLAALRCLGLLLLAIVLTTSGCGTTGANPRLMRANANLGSARQSLFPTQQAPRTQPNLLVDLYYEDPHTYLIRSPAEFAAVKSLQLQTPTLACSPSVPPGKPEAPDGFLTTLGERLRTDLGKLGYEVRADATPPVDAELRIEIYKLHNGVPGPGWLAQGLSNMLTLSNEVPPSDNGVASCNVFFLRPGSPEVIAGFSKAVLHNDQLVNDRFPGMARSLADLVAKGISELKGQCAKPQ